MSGETAFNPGDQVFQRSEPDRVGVVAKDPKRTGPITFVPVIFVPPRVEWVPAENLAPFVGGGVDSHLQQGIFAGHKAFSRLVTFTKLSNPLSDTLYSFLASRTDLYPYQFKPLLKFLESDRKRLLIADEVGLGKTIEAGLILVEQRMREDLQRVLIVCPASLRSKWREEMARRFDEHFEICDKAGLTRVLDDLAERGGAAEFRAIVSFGPIRSREIIERLEAQAPPVDLVIVDEAHHLRNRETLAHRATRAIAEAADAVLLLTATPIHLGNENLLNLLSLLDPEEFDRLDVFERRMKANGFVVRAGRLLLAPHVDSQTVCSALQQVETTSERDRFVGSPDYREFVDRMSKSDEPNHAEVIELQTLLNRLNLLSHVLCRSRKIEVQPDRPRRAPQVQQVRFTALEMEIYEAATEVARETWSHEGGYSADTFRAISRQRQIASCLPAALAHFRENLRVAESAAETDELTDLDADDWGSISPQAAVRDEPLSRYFQRIPELEGQDSKFAALVHALRQLEAQEGRRKLIIFSYFKATLHYLARRLRDLGYQVVVLTGDVPSTPSDPESDERGKRIQQFRDEAEPQIMLSSEVGSEGLDFQFCHVLINYDLPWNPMRVEQRIGRVDRLGQQAERIVVVNLSVTGTIEDRILRRLYERIGIFRESIGDLEAILGDVVTELQAELLGSRLSPEEVDRLIEEKARAVERERKAEQELERRSEELLGHDQLFQAQLRRRQSRHEYVGGTELAIFVSQFLEENFPKARLEYDQARGIGRLHITDDLITFIRRHTPQGEPLVHSFIHRTLRGSCPVTFDAGVAAHDREIEFVAAHHPLVQSIVDAYKADRSPLTPTSILGVESDVVAGGEYLYSFYLMTVTGVRPRKYLEPVLVRICDHGVVGDDEARAVLARLVEQGHDVDRGRMASAPDALIAARDRATRELHERIGRRRENLKRSNNALADMRIASLTASYEARVQRRRELLAEARAKGKDARYIRMLEGTIRNMEAWYRARVEEIDAARAFDVSYEAVGAGVVAIHAGGA